MINIDGVEYTEEQLTEAQRYLVAQIRDVKSQMATLRFKADQLTVLESALSSELIRQITESAEGDDSED